MAQETRKDPRAKVLTMTVRYKSATLDEFIEHHSHDVSRGGMFIKTPSPFPPGTLLKFEVKIAEDQKVIQGVGRVVWKRESETGDKERPSGMGVKFIKIDDASRKTIDQLVDSRADASAAYEAGGGDGGAKTAPSVTPAAAMTPAVPEAASGKPAVPRKATMIGLGAMGSHAAAAAAKAAAESTPPPAAAGNMFPSSDSEADMPPPEDRTVMKQAAELLQDALREAGGSMDDVGTKPDSKKPDSLKAEPEKKSLPTEPEITPESKPKDAPADKGPRTLRSDAPKGDDKKASQRPVAATTAGDRARSERTAPSARPSSRPQPILSEAPASDGGGARVMIILAGIAVAAGAVFFLTKKEPAPPEPEPPPVAAEEKPLTPPPAVVEEPKPPEPAVSAAPAASASAAPVVSAAPSAAAAPGAAKSAALVPPVAPPVPKPAAVPLQPKPKPQPKPVAAEPAEPAPAAEPKPAPAEPAPAPAPKPKPAPAEPAGDNPY
jgi:uncharacterized protein (TIGR02266 family)